LDYEIPEYFKEKIWCGEAVTESDFNKKDIPGNHYEFHLRIIELKQQGNLYENQDKYIYNISF